MKTTVQKAMLFVSLFMFSLCAISQIKIVEINAAALVDDKNTDNYAIVIYSDGVLKDSIYSKKARAIALSLESNKLYSLVFKKSNYPDKLVIVDTKIPSGLRELMEDPFELQIELAQNTMATKQELTDYPVAVLAVNRKVKSLMASENYYKLTHN
ncbi:MAG: hypothetical protein HY062_03655 [Bacteroidetes bacterium]|nr:hypothetical protein [Bacteroidota bacterium]